MKIGILGAGGRMGRMLIAEVLSGHYSCTLGAAVDHANHGQDAGGGVKISADAEAAFKICDTLIDFTAPAASVEHAGLAQKYKKALVIGTTGFGEAQDAAIDDAARAAPILRSYNMSVGVNVLAALVAQVAARLENDFDIEIFEAHHRHKVDAPSGTALLLGDAAAKGRGVKLKDVMVADRTGHTGARKPGTIGMSVFRGGDVIGDHTVTFAGAGERIELSHKASDRAIFARGAVRAAVWLNGKPPGLYAMKDVLGL